MDTQFRQKRREEQERARSNATAGPPPGGEPEPGPPPVPEEPAAEPEPASRTRPNNVLYWDTCPPGLEPYMRTEWVDCPSPTDFEVWTKAYDQFGNEIPRFFPWEGLTGPQRGIPAEVHHVHEKEEWYDREACGINA